jgi:class 3 adenylate cyclase/HAMP domain-containing protein
MIMSLSKKIFVTFFIAVTALLSAVLYLIDTQAEQHETQRIIADLEKTKQQFQRDFEREQVHIQSLTQIIASDQKFRSFLSNIKDNFYPFTAEIGKDTGADFVFMLDDVPSVRASYNSENNQPLPLGHYLAEFEITAHLNSGLIQSTMVSLPNGLYSSHFIPLKENQMDDYAVGLLVVCNAINDRRISQLLVAGEYFQAVFFNQGRVVAKNTRADFAQTVLQQRQAIVKNGEFVWHNNRYIAKQILFDANNPQAGYILSANLDQALETFKQLQRKILWTGGETLVLGALLFMVISRRITRPLRLITKGTLEIEQGHYDHRIDYQSTDEVGQLAEAFNNMASGLEEKDLIRNTFNKYVDPIIVTELLSQPDKLKMGGERKKQTVLFSDIAGFTNFSEKLPAEELVSLLNEYLTAMTAEITHQHGVLDKFIGDAIMAFWTPQLCAENHALYACHTALAMQETLVRLRTRWLAQGKPNISIRIGIATGEMIVGNIGSDQARSYTCIGDKVNYSSRLEGLNKYYGTQIIVDRQTTLDATGLLVRELDTVRVKGREEGEAIYELLALSHDGNNPLIEKIARYQQALGLYKQGAFAEAGEIFASITADAPSQLMLKRCRQFMKKPPVFWNGIYSMSEK